MDSITLQTRDNAIASGEVLGRLGFAASSETGTNARLVVAKVEAIAEEEFTATHNATKMVFYLADDGAAASKMTLSSAGNLILNKIDSTGGIKVRNGDTSAGFIEFYEDSDNGTNKVTLIGRTSTGSDITISLPAYTGTLLCSAGAHSITASAATDTPLINKGESGQSASLQEWQNNSATKLLAVGPDGGLELPDNTPDTTTNKLYNDGGTLKFNGSAVGGGGGVDAANGSDNRIATFTDSDSLNGEANLTFDGSTLTLAGVADITDTTDSSDATGDTGALRCEGGASIAKKLFVGTDLDVDGTTNLDAVDIDGAVDLAGELKLTGAFVPGAGLNASTKTTSINLDLSTGNYFEVTLTSSQNVGTIVFTNAKVGQRFMIRVMQPSSGGNVVLDSVADGWDTISINSDTSTDASDVACKWGGGIGPILTTGDGAADLYGFIIRGVDASAAIDGVIIAQGLAAT